MPGGLAQLVISSGAQNNFLTGNPQISFFKSVYRKYTRFAMEHIRESAEKLLQVTMFFGVYFACVLTQQKGCVVIYEENKPWFTQQGCCRNKLVYQFSVVEYRELNHKYQAVQ